MIGYHSLWVVTLALVTGAFVTALSSIV